VRKEYLRVDVGSLADGDDEQGGQANAAAGNLQRWWKAKQRVPRCSVDGTVPNTPSKRPLLNQFSSRSSLQAKTVVKWLMLDNSKWILLLVAHSGIASLLALLIDEAIVGVQAVHETISTFGDSYYLNLFNYLWFRVLLIMLAVRITEKLSPISAGSGIPEMKAILAGFEVPGALSINTLFTKGIAVVLAIGSGLRVGKEGPFVHIASAVAEQLMSLPGFEKLKNCPGLRSQILASACAVGVASAFGAPIGGVLFSVEATSHYFLTSHYASAFFCAVFGAFVVHLISFETVEFFSPTFGVQPWSRWELFLHLLLALVLGVTGGWFVQFFCWVARFRKAHEGRLFAPFVSESVSAPMMFSIVLSLVLGCIEFPYGSYLRLDMRGAVDDLFQQGRMDYNGTHCTLHTAHCTLSLYTIHCTLYTAHCTLHTVHCTLYTIHYTLSLYTIHCTLYTIHCTLSLYTIHCTLHTVHCHYTLYTIHYTLYTIHCTLYTVHYTLYTIHYTPYTIRHTLYTLHSTLIPRTLYTLHSTLIPRTLYTLHSYPVHSTLYTLHSYPVHSTLYTHTPYTLHSTLIPRTLYTLQGRTCTSTMYRGARMGSNGT
jgi:chloride channel 2